MQRMQGKHGVVKLSIYEFGQFPPFRFTATRPKTVGAVTVETRRFDGARQSFTFVQQGEYWESVDDIPEPHCFDVKVTVGHDDKGHSYSTMFTEHEHSHGNNDEHAHNHDNSHGATKKTTSRTALLLILGSSPMVEGIPAFFAAGKYGPGLIATMALVFAASTILTYVFLCVHSTARLQRVKFVTLERYGEVFSGAFIALVGLAFWMFPIL